MHKDIQNMENFHEISQINSNRSRISIQNFQFEINSLLKQLELLECENYELKQMLFQKNQDILAKVSNSLPKEYTSALIQGMKNQSLHLNMVGDIAMSNILNTQYESTYSKQIQMDIINLRSIIIIQGDKLQSSESKIIELNDFIRQQDCLLTQTKIILKEKCSKIQKLEEKLQEINLQYNHQQSFCSKNYLQSQSHLQSNSEDFCFELQNEQSDKIKEREYQYENFSLISEKELKQNQKENLKQSSLQRVSTENNSSSRTLQVNQNIMNQNLNITLDSTQRQLINKQNQNLEKNDISRKHNQQIFKPEARINNSKSSSLQDQENISSNLFNKDQLNNRINFGESNKKDSSNNREIASNNNKEYFEIREILDQFHQKNVVQQIGLHEEDFIEKREVKSVSNQKNNEKKYFNNKSYFERNNHINQNNLNNQSLQIQRRGRLERQNSLKISQQPQYEKQQSQSEEVKNDFSEIQYQYQQKIKQIPNKLREQQSAQQIEQCSLLFNNIKTISNVIQDFQKENYLINDNCWKENNILNQSLNDEKNSSILSIEYQTNDFETSKEISNNAKSFNLSNLKTINQINSEYQQYYYQPYESRVKVIETMNQDFSIEHSLTNQYTQSPNIVSTIDIDAIQCKTSHDNFNQLNRSIKQQTQLKGQSIHPYQYIQTENNESINNQNQKNRIQEIVQSNNNRNRSSSNYFNIYDQKSINTNQINQIQIQRRSLNTRTEYSNQKSYDEQDNDMRNIRINQRHVLPFNQNYVLKTESSPYKRQNSQSNGRRRSRAERIQKCSSSIRIYNSNDYNTFNPLN